MKILRVFISAAFIAIEPSVANIIDLARKNSEIEDEKDLIEKKKESEFYGSTMDNYGDIDDDEDMIDTGDGIVINLDQVSEGDIFDEVPEDDPVLMKNKSSVSEKKKAHTVN